MDNRFTGSIIETKAIMNVYFVSGLGADRTAFKRISLPAGYSIYYLDWIPPRKNESLEEYCKRLAEHIDQSTPFVLVGLSFGGMVAVTMHRFLKPHKTILISSIASATELPPLFKWAARLRLHKLLPLYIINHPNYFANLLFGARSKNEKKLLAVIMLNGDPAILKWSINAVLTWDQKSRPGNIFQIHGTNDKILPIKYTHPDVVINNGSHFMVWTKAAEVSKAIVKGIES
jgi:pimeloyl-ACP methyl ester carboxylesterase